jgi:hypothetical protein
VSPDAVLSELPSYMLLAHQTHFSIGTTGIIIIIIVIIATSIIYIIIVIMHTIGITIISIISFNAPQTRMQKELGNIEILAINFLASKIPSNPFITRQTIRK